MAEPLILHIETATDICSVALSQGDSVISLVESGAERNHATLLNRFIRECLEKAGKEFNNLDAIAVSKGPGSYTGLRIGVSTAKGLSYGLHIPLLSCLTLENMVHAAMAGKAMTTLVEQKGSGLLLCPLLDARRMEVYSAFFKTDFSLHREVKADIIDESSYRNLLDTGPVVFFGNGAPKCRKALEHENAYFLENIQPSAGAMAGPVLEQFRKSEFEDVAYFEPYYLKDFVATIPRKKVL